MPERDARSDPALDAALAQLDLERMPEPLYVAVATALEWVHQLDVRSAGADSGAGSAGAEAATGEDPAGED